MFGVLLEQNPPIVIECNSIAQANNVIEGIKKNPIFQHIQSTKIVRIISASISGIDADFNETLIGNGVSFARGATIPYVAIANYEEHND